MTSDQSRMELFLAQELGVSDLEAARRRLDCLEVALVLSPAVANDRLGQIAILTAANILCRLGRYCANIAVVVPDRAHVTAGVPLLEPGAPLSVALVRFMEAVQAPEEGPTHRYRVAAPGEVFPLALSFGPDTPRAKRVVYGWYERWTGGFGHEPRKGTYTGPNPFGALIAGALGATAISRLLLSDVADTESAPRPLPDTAALSADSYGRPEHPNLEPGLPEVVDLRALEPMLLVGGGAVASGVALGLASLQGAVGALEAVDDDTLDATNLERHLVSTCAHVGAPKARRIAAIFGEGLWNGLDVRAHSCRYEELARQRWQTVIATVDEAAARRRLQFDLPRVLLNGGTVGPEFLVSSHDYGAGPCAECLYPERPQAAGSPDESLAAQTSLGPGEVRNLSASGAGLSEEQIERIVQQGALVFPPEALERARTEGIRALQQAACTTATVRPRLPAATIGFVAALPGLLLAAELVKLAVYGGDSRRTRPLSGDRNIFRMDTFGDLSAELEFARPSRGCRCQDRAMRAAYAARWGG